MLLIICRCEYTLVLLNALKSPAEAEYQVSVSIPRGKAGAVWRVMFRYKLSDATTIVIKLSYNLDFVCGSLVGYR